MASISVDAIWDKEWGVLIIRVILYLGSMVHTACSPFWSSNDQIPLPSRFSVALITPHTLQRGWRYLVTITYSLVCTSKDREMAGLLSDIFSLEDCIDFSVNVTVVRAVNRPGCRLDNRQTIRQGQAFCSCGCLVASWCPVILNSSHTHKHCEVLHSPLKKVEQLWHLTVRPNTL